MGLAWPALDADFRLPLGVGLLGCAIGLWVMLGIDVPM
jgi:hypothetical protein